LSAKLSCSSDESLVDTGAMNVMMHPKQATNQLKVCETSSNDRTTKDRENVIPSFTLPQTCAKGQRTRKAICIHPILYARIYFV
jgi:predicted aspartyl protease